MTLETENVARPALVILDMAGTTVEDRGEVPEAFTAALEEHGLRISPSRLSDLRGGSKRAALESCVPEGPDKAERVRGIYASFHRRLVERYERDGARATPGAQETIAWLRAAGIRVALNTGFERALVERLLHELRWGPGAVDAIVCGDDVSRGRPSPDLIQRAMRETGVEHSSAVANVGDTVLDLRAGHAAGVRWNLAVLTGAHTRDRLVEAPHTAILAGVVQLRELWP
ncbi:MAG: HAD hydrolase-like protein [Acidobacteriota bacterium]